jgi:two-component system OmpR family response regulator
MSNPSALIVEDDADIAQMYAIALRYVGFDTEIVRDGSTALARLANTSPALVVLDMHLPFVSGAEILRQMRADRRLDKTRVIMTTGDAQMAEALSNDVDLALVKPVSQDQLQKLAARLRPRQ